jgi:uncharacterized protein
MKSMKGRIGIALAVLIAVSALPSRACADVSAVSAPTDSSAKVAKIEGAVQIVITPLESDKYVPFVVQKGIPVRWVLKASAKDLNSCNSLVTVPAYGIRKQLAAGDNVIEFTPDREGTIPYACSMGMVSSTIRVVSDLSQPSIDGGSQCDSPDADATHVMTDCGRP